MNEILKKDQFKILEEEVRDSKEFAGTISNEMKVMESKINYLLDEKSSEMTKNIENLAGKLTTLE